MINLTGLTELSEDTIEAYHLFRHLIAEKDKCDATGNLLDMRITKPEFQAYTDHLIRRFINIIQSPALESSGSNALIFKLLAYAALAHLMTFLSTPSRRGSVLQLMSTRIREILEVVNVPAFQLAYPEMILWILVVGGLSSHYTDYQDFFVRLLADSCLAAGIRNVVDELPTMLADFVWSFIYFSDMPPVSEGFWHHVQLAQMG